MMRVMRMAFMKRTISILMIVTMVLASISFACVKNVEAKNVVKSIKVIGAKKKMTMQVGTKKAFKVKVKAKNKKTGFKVKSSSKKVVSVKKRGKKIVLTAKKQGKAKIVVRSKYNKKKKYVMTIFVKGKTPTVKPDVKPVVQLELNAESVNSEMFYLKFSQTVSISKSNLVARKLISKNGNDTYENVDKIINLDTEDNKTYVVFLEDKLVVPGVKVKFIINVNGKELEAECKVVDDTEPTTFNDTYLGEKGEEVNDEIWLSSEKNAELVSLEGLPEGLTYEFNSAESSIKIAGSFAKNGLFETVAKLKQKNGIINTYNIIFLVGDETNLFAYCEDVNDYVYSSGSEVQSASGYFDIGVSGGSFSYGYKLLDGSDDCFKVTNDVEYDSEEHFYYCDATLEYTEVKKPGVYKAYIEIYDYNNKKVKTTLECKLIINGLNRIKGQVLNKKGKPIHNAFVATEALDDGDYYDDYCLTDDNGNYEVYVSSGTHIIESLFNEVYVRKQRKITADTQLDFTLDDLYEVNISYDNYFIMGNPHYWFKDDGSYTSFYQLYNNRFELDSFITQDVETIYLPEGHHKLVTCGIAYKDGGACKYSATMELDVKGDMNAVAHIKNEEAYNGTTINLNQNINLEDMANGGYMHHFTPSEDGEYIFYFGYNSESYNPYVELIGEDFYAYADDKGEGNKGISLKVNLKAGKTYYYHYCISDLGFDSLVFEEGGLSVKKAS